LELVPGSHGLQQGIKTLISIKESFRGLGESTNPFVVSLIPQVLGQYAIMFSLLVEQEAAASQTYSGDRYEGDNA
jgi:hypothetical protein